MKDIIILIIICIICLLITGISMYNVGFSVGFQDGIREGMGREWERLLPILNERRNDADHFRTLYYTECYRTIL
ncbi:MAG: hypothetical protein LBL61_01630 [Elusimicrobiota bacterium]|jgi:hypothetical protein|nr:hypothetical protein [Elusimicrobiota bacterium]